MLGHDSLAEVPPERPFGDLGFDSLAAVEMRNRLGGLTEMQMPVTLIFDYPTAAAIAGFLLTELRGRGRKGPSELGTHVSRRRRAKTPWFDDQ